MEITALMNCHKIYSHFIKLQVTFPDRLQNFLIDVVLVSDDEDVQLGPGQEEEGPEESLHLLLLSPLLLSLQINTIYVQQYSQREDLWSRLIL